MVDRHAVTTGDYKRWIFSSELIYAGLIFAVAFLDFHTDFYTIVALIIISFVASATQDIATDALAVLAFSRKDKSLVNSMQSMGSFGGSMIGGGVLLLLFKQIGWNWAVALRRTVCHRCPPAALFQQRPPHPTEGHARTGQKGGCDLFLRPPEHLETDRFPFPLLFRLDRYARHVEALAGRLRLRHEGDRSDERSGGDIRRVPLLICRRDDRTADWSFQGTHPVCSICLDSNTLFPRTFVCASYDYLALWRDFPSVGQLRDGDDRSLYDRYGLCTPRTRRNGFHDPNGHHASQWHVDGYPEWENCRSYGLSRAFLL